MQSRNRRFGALFAVWCAIAVGVSITATIALDSMPASAAPSSRVDIARSLELRPLALAGVDWLLISIGIVILGLALAGAIVAAAPARRRDERRLNGVRRRSHFQHLSR